MPVSATICGGMPVPGSTSVASSPIRSPPRTLTAPISVMRSRSARAAGGLQVEDDERDLAQRGAELVEGQLGSGCGRGAGTAADASRTTDRHGILRITAAGVAEWSTRRDDV